MIQRRYIKLMALASISVMIIQWFLLFLLFLIDFVYGFLQIVFKLSLSWYLTFKLNSCCLIRSPDIVNHFFELIDDSFISQDFHFIRFSFFLSLIHQRVMNVLTRWWKAHLWINLLFLILSPLDMHFAISLSFNSYVVHILYESLNIDLLFIFFMLINDAFVLLYFITYFAVFFLLHNKLTYEELPIIFLSFKVCLELSILFY